VKKGTISQRCIACGHTGNVDMRHKLTTFILKNPPEQQDMQTTTPSKGSKKGKKDKVSALPDSHIMRRLLQTLCIGTAQ
jgi:translation initiation factor 5